MWNLKKPKLKKQRVDGGSQRLGLRYELFKGTNLQLVDKFGILCLRGLRHRTVTETTKLYDKTLNLLRNDFHCSRYWKKG